MTRNQLSLRMERFRSICIDHYHLVNEAYAPEAYELEPETVPWLFRGQVEEFPLWLVGAILTRL